MLSVCLCVWLAVGGVVGQKQPPSPCPDVFRYELDGGVWSGQLTVPVPDRARRIKVVVTLFVASEAPVESVGDLKLKYDKDLVRENIFLHQANTIDYELILPVQSPLPVIDKIRVNKQVICQGQPVKGLRRIKVSYSHSLNGLQPSQDMTNSEVSDLNRGNKNKTENTSKDVVETFDTEEILEENPKKGLPKKLIRKFKVIPQGEERVPSVKKIQMNLKGEPEELENPSPKNDDRKFQIRFRGEKVPDFQNKDKFDPKGETEVLDSEFLQGGGPNVYTQIQGRNFDFGFKDVNGVAGRPEVESNPDDEVETLDNEVLGGSLLPFNKNQGRTFNFGSGDKNNRPGIPETELNPDDDVEMLNNEVNRDNSPEVAVLPPSSVNFNGEFQGPKIRPGKPKSELYPSDDAEMLDEGNRDDSPEVPVFSPSKDYGVNFNGEFQGPKIRPGKPKSELNPSDDAEMLDNEVNRDDSPEVAVFSPSKKYGGNFNEDFGASKFRPGMSKMEPSPDDDLETFDNEVYHDDSPEVALFPPSKNNGSFRKGMPKSELNPEDDNVETMNNEVYHDDSLEVGSIPLPKNQNRNFKFGSQGANRLIRPPNDDFNSKDDTEISDMMAFKY